MSTVLGILGTLVLLAVVFFAVKAIIWKIKKKEGCKSLLKKAGACFVVSMALFFGADATMTPEERAAKELANQQRMERIAQEKAEKEAKEKAEAEAKAQAEAEAKAQQEAQEAAKTEQAAADKPKVDFAKIAAEIVPSIKKQHPDVLSLDIKPESNRIVFRAIINYDTAPKEALEITDSILRKYASEANFANSKIPGPGGEKNAYGGLYDYYDAVLEIIPEGSENDKKDWFIKQTIKGNKTNFLTTQSSHGGITRN